MKVPVSWLREYVAIAASPADIAEKLTFSGVEVEGIEFIAKDGLPGVVAAEILAVQPHPNADRLSVCQVFDGVSEYQVVCGAPNVVPGARGAFAPVGTVLPDGMKLKRAKIRGVESLGMLCSEDELGLSDDHEGILILPADTQAGAAVADLLGLPDAVLSLEVTWNRPDCLSIVGIARELAAVYGKTLRIPESSLKTTQECVSDAVTVRIDAPELCQRYVARVLRNVQLAESPLWLRRRLMMCGVRPISNVVDITNYVMLELGQPLHAFDGGRIGGNEIVVRRASDAEPFATLDGLARILTPDMLVIADARHPVALAGVMGGMGSGISDSTATVLLESASFDAASIHETSKKLTLKTESSHRFERGVPPDLCEMASVRAASLMQTLCGAEVLQGAVDAYPAPAVPKRLVLHFAELNERLGVSVVAGEVVGILNSLGIVVRERDASMCQVEVPWFRLDLAIEADLVEEIARIRGLDGIPSNPPSCPCLSSADDSVTYRRWRLQDLLHGLGVSETMNYSFLSERLLAACGLLDDATVLRLPNPVSADYAVMRNSLVPQMIATLGRNIARQAECLSLYELGKVYAAGKDEPEECERLCIGFAGPVGVTGPARLRALPSQEDMFLWMKGLVECLCEARWVGGISVADSSVAWSDPAWCAEIWRGDKPVGVIGLLADAIRAEWRMPTPVALAEIDVAALLQKPTPCKPLCPSPYPALSRDIALVVHEQVRHADIERVIRKSASCELTDVTLFDTFRGAGIGEGLKSMAYSLTFRSGDRSLTDEEANRYQEAVKLALRTDLKAETR